MSYSVCLNCREKVSVYQKYCPICEKTHKQNETFWRSGDERGSVWSCDILRKNHISDDKISKGME